MAGHCYDTILEMRLRLIRPLQIGLESVKAIVLPAVVLWSAAGALVAGYYGFDCVRSAIEPVERRLAGLGAWGGFVSLAFYLGFLPGVFFLFVRSMRPKHPWTTCIAQSGWNGLWGVACTYFFQLQDRLFGTGRDFCTLAAKTTLDQFFWTAFVIAPLNAVFYFWLSRDFSIARVRIDWPKGFFRNLVMPNLLMNWIVGIPNNFAVYAFPSALRIQVVGLLSAFWVLVCLQIGRRSGRSDATTRRETMVSLDA